MPRPEWEVYETREEWLAARRGSLGSSAAPALLGLSRFESPFSLWAEWTGRVQPDGENPSLVLATGHHLEPMLAAALQRELGDELNVWDPGEAIVRSARLPRRHASPDRLVLPGESRLLDLPGEFDLTERLLVELKTFHPSRLEHWQDGPDEYALLQVHHQMAVLGTSEAIVVGYPLGSDSIIRHDVELDAELLGLLMEAENEFLRAVDADEPPDLDGSEATREALKLLYPSEEAGKVIEVATRAHRLAVEAYQRAKETADVANQDLEAAKTQLIGLIGGAERLVTGENYDYTYKLTSRKEHAVKASQFRQLRRVKARKPRP